MELGEQKVEFVKEKEVWTLSLPHALFQKGISGNLALLEIELADFLPMEIKKSEEGVDFTYNIPGPALTFADLKKESRLARLVVARRLLALHKLVDLPFSTLLDPANLYIDLDYEVRLAYRGLPDFLPPQALSQESFLREWQAVVVSLFSSLTYEEAMKGATETSKLSLFLDQVLGCQNIEDSQKLIQEAYLEERERQTRETLRVSRRGHLLYKQATIWLGALAIALALPLIYVSFFQLPFKDKLLKADQAYLKLDYSGLMTILEGVPLQKLPLTQKLELATSYVKSLSFSDEQRQVILNNVSFKSDEIYLDYWIQIGRKELDSALDLGKRLEDSDLIVYALVQKMQEVRKDQTLSAKEREQELASLESDYKKYWDQRQTLLEETGNSTSSDSVGTPTSSTSKKDEGSSLSSSND